MYVEICGSDAADAETVVLSAGLGGSAGYWTPQLDALSASYRVVLYDHFGTGRSPGNVPAGYSIGVMANELLAELDRHGVEKVHFVGHALGGLVGMELQRLIPSRVRSLVLMNAWGEPNPHTARCFSVRRKLLEHAGPAAYVEAQALFLYPPTWIAVNDQRLKAEELHALERFPPVANMQRRIDALLAYNPGRDVLEAIEAPTLLIANRDDMLIPWTCSQALAEVLPQAELVIMEHGGHASSVTESEAINSMLVAFLGRMHGEPGRQALDRRANHAQKENV